MAPPQGFVPSERRNSAMFASTVTSLHHRGDVVAKHGTEGAYFIGSLRSGAPTPTRKAKTPGPYNPQPSPGNYHEAFYEPPETVRSATQTPRGKQRAKLPYDEPPPWSSFEGWMFRREWTNPYPEDTPKGKLAAYRRKQMESERKKKINFENYIRNMKGKPLIEEDKTESSQDLFMRAFQKECQEVEAEEAAFEQEAEEHVQDVEAVREALQELEDQAKIVAAERARVRAEMRDLQTERGKMKDVDLNAQEETILLKRELSRLEVERSGMNQEREAVEAARSALSDLRIQARASNRLSPNTSPKGPPSMSMTP